MTVQGIENIRKLMREGYSAEGEKHSIHCQATGNQFYGIKFIDEGNSNLVADTP